MSDALCGPSNALQNFQKHASVDRTLQQDRLLSRQSPSQGFRSLPGPNAGILDADFEAFQAGHPGPRPENAGFLPPGAATRSFPPGAPALPDWAADFQRLHVSPPPPASHQAQRLPPHSHAHHGSASWHQDFLQQQAPPAFGQSSHYTQPMMHRPMTSMHGSPYMQQPFHMQEGNMKGMGKQAVEVPSIDDAAFERAFDAARADILSEETAQQTYPQEAKAAEQQPMMHLPVDLDPNWTALLQTNVAIYLALKFRAALTGGYDVSPVDTDTRSSQISLYLGALEHMERQGEFELGSSDVSESRIAEVRGLVKLLESHRENLSFDSQHMIEVRVNMLLQKLPNITKPQAGGSVNATADDLDRQQRLAQSIPTLQSARILEGQSRDSSKPSLSGEQEMRMGYAQRAWLHSSFNMYFPGFAGAISRRMHETVQESRSPAARGSSRGVVNMLYGNPLQDTEELEENYRPLEAGSLQTAASLSSSLEHPQEMQHSSTTKNPQELPEWIEDELPASEQQNTDASKPDDEELARTAGQLLDSVSHETSAKFQQSNFLALMRRLRDHEVRVDGDKMVETNGSNLDGQTLSPTQNDLDLGRDDARHMTGALPQQYSDDHDMAASSAKVFAG